MFSMFYSGNKKIFFKISLMSSFMYFDNLKIKNYLASSYEHSKKDKIIFN